MLAESRAGNLQADLVGLAFDVANEIKGAGVLARYLPPERKAYADAFKDAEGYFTPTHLIHAVIGYNSKLVSPREAPKDYPDLLSPFWRGTLTIDTEPSRALIGWLKAWGEEKTRRYLDGLARNGVTVTRGHTLQTQLLCAGEYKVGIELYLYTAAQMRRTGCPINIVYPNPTTVASAQSWAIPLAAPRHEETVVGCHADDWIGTQIRQAVDFELISRRCGGSVIRARINNHVVNQESAGTVRFRQSRRACVESGCLESFRNPDH